MRTPHCLFVALVPLLLAACSSSPPSEVPSTPDSDLPPDDQPLTETPPAATADATAAPTTKPPANAKPEGCDAPEDCAEKGAQAAIRGENAKAAAMLSWACNKDVALACSNMAALYVTGKGVDKDEKRAVALAEKSCKAGAAPGCAKAAIYHHAGTGTAPDKSKALGFFEAGCKLGDTEGCYNAGVLLFRGDGVTADPAKANPLFEKSCDAKSADGCFNVGVGYLKGKGVSEDHAIAEKYMKKACKAGSKKGCELAEQLAKKAKNATAKVKGANLTVGSMTANGMTVNNLQCRLIGGGIFASMGIVAGLAKQKASLDACARGGAAPEVVWSFSNGRVTKVKVDKAGRAGGCVSRALKRVSFPSSGECAAQILIGNKAGAKRAAKANATK